MPNDVLVLQKSVVLTVVATITGARGGPARIFRRIGFCKKPIDEHRQCGLCRKLTLIFSAHFALEHHPIFVEQGGGAPGWPAHRQHVY